MCVPKPVDLLRILTILFGILSYYINRMLRKMETSDFLLLTRIYYIILGWDGLSTVPDLSNLKEESELVARRMLLDLPEDEGATGK